MNETDKLRESVAIMSGLTVDEIVELGDVRQQKDVCAEDCDPGGNSEDHRVHSSHESCDVCPYHAVHSVVHGVL